jgi:pyruvate/2-oxoglutarate dehydrogenase complex dihydrolipoamide dehydrogenase (E3) component
VTFDEKTICSSTGALSLEKVPGKLIVIGAGVIGLELGSVWRRLGAEVTVVEYLDRILPGMDADVVKTFQRMLEKQGVKFHLSSKVTAVEKGKKGGKVTFEPVAGGDAQSLEADVVLVATGRRPYTDGLGLEAAGVAMDRGRVVIDDHFRANVAGIYAIGDVVRGPMLAHKAEDEGVAVAEIIAGQHGHVNYEVIPGVVYTSPEIAAVGATEEDLKARRRRLQGRQVQFHRQRPRPRHARHGRLRESAGRRRHRPRARRPHPRPRRRRTDRRSRRADGVRRFGRRPRPHLPRPPDHVGSGDVRTHNFGGRLYMMVIKPFHRVIVRSMLSNAAARI